MVEIFTDVADTPMFRQKICDLEAGAKRLRDRCSGFVVGTRKYRDGVAAMHDAEVSFASALHEFCGGSDEDSLLIGGAVMSKYVSTFRELASFHDVLRAQVDVCLVEILQQTWVDGILAKVREDQKRFDKKMQEHEQARIKYLALKKVTKKEVLEKAHAELVATRIAAEDLRFEIARKLSEVECRKRYMFLEAMTSSMHFHLKFFEHARSLLKNLEPLISQTWEIVDHLKQEEEARTKQMEVMVSQFKQYSADRERLLEQFNIVEEVGPLQMSASKQLLLQEIEALIRNTHNSGGTQVTIIKQAYLHKKSNQLRNDWKRRFFVLDSQGMLYYYSHKDAGMMGSLRKHKPKNTVNLLTSTVKMDDEDRSMRFCFRVVSPEGTYTLQAENELERHEWVDSLQAVINCLLSGDGPGRSMPRIPVKPTHSRSNSAASDLDPFNTSFSSAPCGTALSVCQPSTRSMGERDLSIAGPLERLRNIPGNRFCVDCGAMDPDWASLNLGVLMCIECSGLHRQLGVHISKVRSCTLDVKVWEPSIINIFEALGNEYATQVWEAHLQGTVRKGDSWVWCDDSDDEDAPLPRPLALRRGGGSSEPLSQEMLMDAGMSYTKPTTTSPLIDKQKYILEKYVNRAFVAPASQEAQNVWLWEAVECADIRAAYHVLACGVNINTAHSSPKALALAQDTHNSTGKPVDSDSYSKAVGNVTVLHLASAIGNEIMMEFLLQNNASFECVDVFNRSALHYCILHEQTACAKILLRRGAPTVAKDVDGRTPFDCVMLRGRVSDEELFILLSGTK